MGPFLKTSSWLLAGHPLPYLIAVIAAAAALWLCLVSRRRTNQLAVAVPCLALFAAAFAAVASIQPVVLMLRVMHESGHGGLAALSTALLHAAVLAFPALLACGLIGLTLLVVPVAAAPPEEPTLFAARTPPQPPPAYGKDSILAGLTAGFTVLTLAVVAFWNQSFVRWVLTVAAGDTRLSPNAVANAVAFNIAWLRIVSLAALLTSAVLFIVLTRLAKTSAPGPRFPLLCRACGIALLAISLVAVARNLTHQHLFYSTATTGSLPVRRL